MPGRIVRVHVSEGDHVAANDPLLVLEAMKMEHVIAAAGAGRVSQLLVAVGDQVARGAPLVRRCDADRPARAPTRRGAAPAARCRPMTLPERVTIVEVGPRDGLQNEAAAHPDRRQGRVHRRC